MTHFVVIVKLNNNNNNNFTPFPHILASRYKGDITYGIRAGVTILGHILGST